MTQLKAPDLNGPFLGLMALVGLAGIAVQAALGHPVSYQEQEALSVIIGGFLTQLKPNAAEVANLMTILQAALPGATPNAPPAPVAAATAERAPLSAPVAAAAPPAAPSPAGATLGSN